VVSRLVLATETVRADKPQAHAAYQFPRGFHGFHSAAGTPEHLRVTTRPVAQIVDDEHFQTACQEAFGVVTVADITRLLSTGDDDDDDVWGTCVAGAVCRGKSVQEG
jgi:hypothetical protein